MFKQFPDFYFDMMNRKQNQNMKMMRTMVTTTTMITQMLMKQWKMKRLWVNSNTVLYLPE